MSSRQVLEIELARLTERFEAQPGGRMFAPLADCHRKLGQLDTALQICLTGLARHPRYSSAQLILGKIFLDRGEDVPAREALERVLELDGQNLLAIQLLAEVAERLGEWDEAESRWRELGSVQDDPELAVEKLAELEQRRNPPPAEEVPDAEAADGTGGDEEGDEVGPAAEEAAPEPDLVFPDVPSAALDPAVSGAGAGQTREIATLTLAGIYAEQGFKSKALEIYRAIAARNPELPGVAEKIAAIEAAMARVNRDAVEGIEEADPKVAAGIEVVATASAEAEEGDEPEPLRPDPLLSDVSGPSDPVAADAGRYRRFGTWLDRVKQDDD